MDYSEKMQRCHEYVEALEEEKRKIQVFQRELPLCLELVTQAIDACRRELSGTTTEYIHGQSECSEQTSRSSDAPVLEEFMPLKSSDGNDREQHSEEEDDKNNALNNREKNSDTKKKSDWLRSVQLWNNSNNQSPESDPSPPQPKVQEVGRKATVVEVKKNGGAFQPFHKEKSVVKNTTATATATATEQVKSAGKANSSPVAVPATSSTTETVSNKSSGGGAGGGGSSKKEEKEGQRKQRRCWSPELHRRFLNALQQLGGSHVATPKQIRELMKVDGLTNDEVKSHLQKYRLHTRRPTSSIHNNTNTQATQVVVVGLGGIWVPPPEYATAAAKSSGETAVVAGTNKIYAPVAAPPPSVPLSSASLMQISHSEDRNSSHSEGANHSSSPATSSSTHSHTTTASAAY